MLMSVSNLFPDIYIFMYFPFRLSASLGGVLQLVFVVVVVVETVPMCI